MIFPRIIKACNLTIGVWYNSHQLVPPDDRQVLCCDRQKSLWFAHYDSYENLWTEKTYDSECFFWQEVSKPLDFLFD